jgi:iron complex transport system ATP-binding protein
MLLQVENLHAHYRGTSTTPVLKGVSFTAHPGQVTIIVGPNGCGKSTLLRCIARLHQPECGTIRLAGQSLWQLKPKQAARQLTMLPQSPTAPESMTVLELVRFGRHPHQSMLKRWTDQDESAIEQAVQQTHLEDLTHRQLNQLSGGQRQRAWLAMTLAQQTPLMLLDEPTSMLDLGHQVQILNLIREIAITSQRSIVIVLHDLIAAAQYADQLITMRDGNILASGSPHKILNAKLVRELYDVETEILHSSANQTPIVVARQYEPHSNCIPAKMSIQSD